MTPDEAALSRELFDGVPVQEVSASWFPPFQPWADDQTSIDFWAWQRPDTFTPVYMWPKKELTYGKES